MFCVVRRVVVSRLACVPILVLAPLPSSSEIIKIELGRGFALAVVSSERFAARVAFLFTLC